MVITTAHPVTVPTRTHVAWLGRLRIWLTVLVVAHHAADTYATISGWYVPEPGHDASAMVLTVFLIVNQTWFMGLFFLLSGVFVPASLDRKGTGRFTRDRLVRLGVPILAYWLIIRPVCLVPAALYQRDHVAGFSVGRFLAYGGDPGVTWFLEVLLVLTLAYVLVRRFLRPVTGGAGLVLAVTGVLALATWVWQWGTPPGTYWPIAGLPTPSFLPQYALFFVAGLLLRPRLTRRYVIPALVAVAAGTILYAPTVGRPVDVHHLATGALSALGQALFAVGAAVLLILLLRGVFARPAGRVTRFLAGQSFVVYLIHPAILVGVAEAIGPLQAPSGVKFAVLFAIAAPLSWLAGWLLRKVRVIRAVT